MTTNELKSTRAALSLKQRWSRKRVEKCAEFWNLSMEEQYKLMEMKLKLADIEYWKNDPFEVVRYLTDFQFNLKKTEAKFRAMVKWRLKHDMDSMLQTYAPPLLFRQFPLAVLKGRDMDGDPIYVERLGSADMMGFVRRFKKKEAILHAMWSRELLAHGPHFAKDNSFRQLTVIVDLQGLNVDHANPKVAPVGKKVLRMMQDYYAGMMKRLVLINAPPVFEFVWSVFKFFVDEHNKKRMVVVSAKESEATLAEFMDITVLPKELLPNSQKELKGAAAPVYEPLVHWPGGKLPPKNPETDWNRMPIVVVTGDKDKARPETFNTDDVSVSDDDEQDDEES